MVVFFTGNTPGRLDKHCKRPDSVKTYPLAPQRLAFILTVRYGTIFTNLRGDALFCIDRLLDGRYLWQSHAKGRNVVDFAREHAIKVTKLAKELELSMDTMRRHIKRGLQVVKVGGTQFTSRERWSAYANGSQSATLVDRRAELEESLAALSRR